MTKKKATTVRLDPAIRPRVDRFADATHRSMNGAVNALAEKALDAWEAEQEKQAA